METRDNDQLVMLASEAERLKEINQPAGEILYLPKGYYLYYDGGTHPIVVGFDNRSPKGHL